MNKRIIKFRIWDKREKIWATPEKHGDNFAISLDGTLATGYIDGDMISLSKEEQEKDFVVEQFTDLLDKNGKEIFEGDIVRGLLNPEYENFIVVFDHGCFSIKRPIAEGCISLFEMIETKVIGNIHENPELVKV
jgi:uncharacterized phage protein (TIGR01671 family)